MSINISAQLVDHRESEKRRILVTVEHELVDLSFVMNAQAAESLAHSLLELARTARGKLIILPGGGEA